MKKEELSLTIKKDAINKKDIIAVLKNLQVRSNNLHLIKSVLREIVAVDPSARPPKKWWDKMYKKVKKNNPNYSDEQIRKTIGKIWYQRLRKPKKSEIRKREGKHLK